MKKLLITLTLLLSACTAYAYDYPAYIKDALKDGQTINYSADKKQWSRDIMRDGIIFTKFMTKGSGGLSVFEKEQKQYEPGKEGTTYEFLAGNDLIGYNAHLLKFYKLDFDGEKISAEELNPNQVQALFPGVEIVKVSQFKNNHIELKKPWFKKKTFMLLNDRSTFFYKYQFENVKKYELIRGIFEVNKPKTMTFSHFGAKNEMFPALTIKIKNGR